MLRNGRQGLKTQGYGNRTRAVLFKPQICAKTNTKTHLGHPLVSRFPYGTHFSRCEFRSHRSPDLDDLDGPSKPGRVSRFMPWSKNAPPKPAVKKQEPSKPVPKPEPEPPQLLKPKLEVLDDVLTPIPEKKEEKQEEGANGDSNRTVKMETVEEELKELRKKIPLKIQWFEKLTSSSILLSMPTLSYTFYNILSGLGGDRTSWRIGARR
ncbi:hypothetical protein M0R45_025709 [Rubus argutus]|uniref:Uncharacterized protein n=1 Tax=Rubus argutus TaxID=59490 RepID=A0AAW1WUT3_RUBAR